MFLATNLNFHYTKDDILLYWINNVNFPYHTKGFKQACNLFFSRPCDRLFDSELLFLFAIYQTWKNPMNNFQIVKNRSKILCNYLKLNCKNFTKLPPVSKKDLKLNFKKLTIFDLLDKKLKSKLKINPKYQALSENIIKNSLSYRQSIWMGDCCILILDKKWNILTMNTCRKPWNEKWSSWINACLIKRQTWSAIKPFVYLKAMIDFNWTWWTILEDKPVDFVLKWLKKYVPRNFDLKYHGKVPLVMALWSSLNVPAVVTVEKIGVQNFIDFINQLRLALGEDKKQIEADKQTYTADKLGLSVALGTYEMSVLQFANLWRLFLYDMEWWKISKKLSMIDNKIIWDYVTKIKEIYKILSDNKNRLLSFDLENNLDIRWYAVKTWTSRHFVDGWTCGVNKEKQIVLCVWAWNVNQQAMQKPGSESAWYLWKLIANSVNKISKYTRN